MGRISTALEGHTLVGLDTSIFIYHLEGHADYLPLTQELLSEIESGRRQGVTSVVTLMELAVQPYRLRQPDVVRKTEALLVNFPHLTFVNIDRSIAHRAARLRADHRLRSPDALQVAACLQAGATAWVTNDHQLARLGPLLKVIVLDEWRNG